MELAAFLKVVAENIMLDHCHDLKQLNLSSGEQKSDLARIIFAAVNFGVSEDVFSRYERCRIIVTAAEYLQASRRDVPLRTSLLT